MGTLSNSGSSHVRVSCKSIIIIFNKLAGTSIYGTSSAPKEHHSQRSSPVAEGIFDVVAGGVDEHTMLVPTCTLEAHVLVHCTHTLQLTVAHTQSYKERDSKIKLIAKQLW